MDESILVTIRKLVGPGGEHTFFDDDYIAHINTALFRLRQIGIGPKTCFRVTGTTETWRDLVGDSDLLDAVIDYVRLVVKQLFDPASNGTIKAAEDAWLAELVWTLNVAVDPGEDKL